MKFTAPVHALKTYNCQPKTFTTPAFIAPCFPVFGSAAVSTSSLETAFTHVFQQGEKIMAQRWFEAIKSYMKKL